MSIMPAPTVLQTLIDGCYVQEAFVFKAKPYYIESRGTVKVTITATRKITRGMILVPLDVPISHILIVSVVENINVVGSYDSTTPPPIQTQSE